MNLHERWRGRAAQSIMSAATFGAERSRGSCRERSTLCAASAGLVGPGILFTWVFARSIGAKALLPSAGSPFFLAAMLLLPVALVLVMPVVRRTGNRFAYVGYGCGGVDGSVLSLNADGGAGAGVVDGEGSDDAGVLPAEFECAGECVQSEVEPRAGDVAGRRRCARGAVYRWRRMGLVRVEAEGRVSKFSHKAYDRLQLRRPEAAALGVLLLRGAQTPAEIRARTERIFRV